MLFSKPIPPTLPSKKPFLATTPKGPAVYLPKYTVTLLPPASHHKKNQASFRIPSHINKFDLYQYLTKIYGLNVLKIATYNFIPKYYEENGVKTRTRAWKKAIVDLDHDFKFPSLPEEQEPEKKVDPENVAKFIKPQRQPHLLKRRRGLRPLQASTHAAKRKIIPRKKSKSKYNKDLKRKSTSKWTKVALLSSIARRKLAKKIKKKDKRMMPRIIVNSIYEVPKDKR